MLHIYLAQENPSWGYDRMVEALANLGQSVCDQRVGNVFKRHGIARHQKRKHTTLGRDFIGAHMEVLAGTDFFTVEGFTLKGFTVSEQQWMEQQGGNETMKDWGFLQSHAKLLIESY